MRKVAVAVVLGLIGAAIVLNLRTGDPIVLGKKYLAEHNYDQAIIEFTKAIKSGGEQKDPDRNPYLLRSLAYKEKGDELGAETDLVKANEQIGALELESWMSRNQGAVKAPH